MTYRVSLLLFLLALCVPSTVPAQTPTSGVTLFGKIQDAQTRAALPYLPVQLQTEKDSAFVGGGLTNEAGEFTFAGLKKGVYVLVVRSIGFQPIRQRVLIGELSPFLDLGALPMVRQAQTLSEVAVTGNRGWLSPPRWTRRPSPSPTTSASRAVRSCRRCPPFPA